MGKCCPIVWDVEWSNSKIMKINYTVGLIGHQLADQNTTTNQKQVAATKGSMERICNERGAWGEHDAFILRAL